MITMISQDRPIPRQLVLPPRPRGPYATRFKAIEISSNHYEATLKGINQIVIFKMKVSPHIPADNAVLRQEISHSIRGDVSKRIVDPVFRGFCIYSREQAREKEFSVKYKEYTVTIQQRKVYEVGSKPNVFLLFLNNALRGIMSRLGYVEIGKSGKYFTTSKPILIDNLDMYKGFASNFVECERGMFLRVDSARKVVRSQTVLDQINSIYSKFQGHDKQQKRNQVQKALINTIIMTSYGKCTFYRIVDIEFKSMNEVRIGQEFPSLKDYYSKRYGLTIKHQNQPLIKAENKSRRRQINGTDQGPIYLLPELCQLTGIPDDFDQRRRKKISDETILSPLARYKEIQAFMKQLQSSNEIKTLSDIGINLNQKINKFQAKVIPKPALALGNNSFVEKGKEASFQFFANPIYLAKKDVNCVIIHGRNSDISGLTEAFEKTSRTLKVKLRIERLELRESFRDKDFINGIDLAVKKYEEANILIVVIPLNLKPAYPKLKQFTLQAEKRLSILTQIVTDGTLRKKNITVYTKVLLQVIAKRGNILWVPSYQEDIANKLQQTMLIGIDSASRGGSNIWAACGTINSTFSMMASAVASNTSCDSSSFDKKFNSMLEVSIKCIEGYSKRNNRPPKKIIVFLNGSPGDQINLIQDHFAKPLFNRTNNQTELIVVLVNLRNSQRFFSSSMSDNATPGTLVSSCVVSNNYDFFIVSQQSTKGSVVPNHYKVIFSTSKLEEGHLQELIFSQCFNYANWTGSIKIPAILQYAKKCARFNAEVLGGQQIDPELSLKPYFI